jgi:hypothetical protein
MRRKVCREKTCFLSLRARVGCGIMFQYVQIVQTYRMEQTDTSVPHGEEGFKMKEFYRVSEVMVILNLGRTKTYDLIRAGVIPSAYIDGSLRVPVKLLHEKIETIISASRRCESIIAQPPPHCTTLQSIIALHRSSRIGFANPCAAYWRHWRGK